MGDYSPSYLDLLKSGELETKVVEAYQSLTACRGCGHECNVNRRIEKVGICKTGELAKVSSYGPHLGEEDPLRGHRGSGTIFFTRCNLCCQYCQNHDISQTDKGHEIEPEDLAVIMLDLQDRGCHNINFVSPSHVVPQILAGVLIASSAGLKIPLVYNSGGYDSLSSLHILDGVVDIYMPDMKYADPRIGSKYSKIPDYPNINQPAVKEMHRQVGDLILDSNGIATRGLLVRHLVLPNNFAGTDQVVSFIAKNVSKNTYINIMDQYRPAFKSYNFPEIDRPITKEEYSQAVDWALQAGLERLDKRRSGFLW